MSSDARSVSGPAVAVPKAVECCTWCRQPVSLCSDPSCDDAITYSGVLVGREWKPLDKTDEVLLRRSHACLQAA